MIPGEEIVHTREYGTSRFCPTKLNYNVLTLSVLLKRGLKGEGQARCEVCLMMVELMVVTFL